MSLSPTSRLFAGLCIGAGLFASRAEAQHIPPDVKGAAAMQMRHDYELRQEAAQRAKARDQATNKPVAPQPFQVTISISPAKDGATTRPADSVGVRGPDGVVRYFAVDGGASALDRVVVVRPGRPVELVVNLKR